VLRAQPARLLAIDKTAPGPRLVVLQENEATIGSANGSALQVCATGVTGHHALIQRARGRYYLVNLAGGAVTRINGRTVRRGYRLRHGDSLSFGQAPPYRFIDPDGAKRLRNRRIIRAAAAATVVVAAVAAHLSGLDGGLLSPATISGFSRGVQQSQQSMAKQIAEDGTVQPAVAARHESARVKRAGASESSTIGARTATSVSSNAVPAPSPSPSITAGRSDGWLKQLNYYRTLAGLSALAENSKLNASVGAHAHYLMANFAGKIRNGEPLGNADHDEDPSRPGYSADGRAAAQNSQVAWGCGAYDYKSQIAHWIAGPFHRFAILNPSITEAGFGETYGDGCWVAGLRLPPVPEEVKPYARAVEFPPDGATVSLGWSGVEWPDPLTACPSYTRPVGLPITLQLGRLVDAALTAHSLTSRGQVVESCAFDARGYRNPDRNAQEYGRWALRRSGAVVVIPRAPLESGAQYSVSITAHGKTYAWSFRVAD
jgi:uncharacterized protein YkwD